MDNRRSLYEAKKEELKQCILDSNPNIIADDLIVKYTINLPIPMNDRIVRRCRYSNGCFKKHRSEWIRKAIEEKLERDEETQRQFNF